MTPTPDPPSYLVRLAAVVCSATMILAALSWSHDPYRVLHDSANVVVTDYEPNLRYLKIAFLLRAASKTTFDAFLFGGSASEIYRPEQLSATFSEREAQPLRFYNLSVSEESTRGILDKLRLLLGEGYRPRKVILSLRHLEAETMPTPLRREHPAVSGEAVSIFKLRYATLYLQGSERAVLHALRRAIAPLRSPARRYVLSGGYSERVDQDAWIRNMGARYYATIEPLLRAPTPVEDDVWSLSTESRLHLEQIVRLVGADACRTIHIVLEPGRTPAPLDAESERFLDRHFCWVHRFDPRAPEAMDPTNYYDPTHYRPRMARWILDRIADQIHSAEPGALPLERASR